MCYNAKNVYNLALSATLMAKNDYLCSRMNVDFKIYEYNASYY